MLITAYLINGQSVGVDLSSWLTEDLNGNPAFKAEDSVSEGYADITSITSWDRFGLDTGKDFKVIKYQIYLLRIALGYENLSLEEQIITNKWFASGVEYINAQVPTSEQKIYFTEFFKPGADGARQQRDVAVSSYMMQLVYTGQFDYLVLCDLIQNARSLRTEYLRDGVTGIGYGDAVDGVVNYTKNDGGYSPMDILGVNVNTKTFSVFGDKTSRFVSNYKFRVRNATGNDGLYTIVSSSYDNTNTNVVVSEVIPSSTADGKIYTGGFMYYEGVTQQIVDDVFDIYWNGIY